MTRLSQKQAGAYYTPPPVVSNLVGWSVRKESDRLLDPSCGDGRFIAAHRNSFGVEQDTDAVAATMNRAPWGDVHEGEFFAWATRTRERFECAAGNPPFIRYQTFNGATRERALQLCESLGAKFSVLSASWAPFLVATASLLKPGGRMAFVVPAAIGHAPYAAPLLDYLAKLTHVGLLSDLHVRAHAGVGPEVVACSTPGIDCAPSSGSQSDARFVRRHISFRRERAPNNQR